MLLKRFPILFKSLLILEEGNVSYCLLNRERRSVMMMCEFIKSCEVQLSLFDEIIQRLS